MMANKSSESQKPWPHPFLPFLAKQSWGPRKKRKEKETWKNSTECPQELGVTQLIKRS